MLEEFCLPPFDFSVAEGKRVLVAGTGGGSDIITAYAVARHLLEMSAQAVVYGNAKRRVPADHSPVTAHILRVPPEVRPLRAGGPLHGTTAIDQSVPRGDQGCPWILLPGRGTEAAAALAAEIDGLGFELALSVDTGADSIASDGRTDADDRDRSMLDAFSRLTTPWIHLVIGPGADGAATARELEADITALVRAGRCLGSFDLAPLLPALRELSGDLPANRTPRLILAAFDGSPREIGEAGQVLVPRGRRPVLSREWLRTGFAFNIR